MRVMCRHRHRSHLSLAVEGATTRLGGVLREATGDFDVSGTHRKAASVGDFIEYEDGTRSQIVTGVGLTGRTHVSCARCGR